MTDHQPLIAVTKTDLEGLRAASQYSMARTVAGRRPGGGRRHH